MLVCAHATIFKMSNESSNWLTVSQSKYETSSEALEAEEVAAYSREVADVSLAMIRVAAAVCIPPPTTTSLSSS